MSQAAIWTLENATAAESVTITENNIFSTEHGGLDTHESIIGKDGRVRAYMSDFMDNGRYRSVVKIQARFGDAAAGNSVWMMGSGWLIKPDLLVTAGHVVYDWSRRLGEAREIKCYIGYNGRASIGEHYVQSRSAVKVVTTAEWLEDTAQRARTKDVAFIQVDRAFTGNLQLFNFVDTPLSAEDAKLGVVGYPGDKFLRDEERDSEEYGAQMYEEFLPTNYNLEKNKRNMIEYQVSTFGGQSGAPIIRRGNNTVVIGTHCYGGGGYEGNSGNAMGGKYGNNYKPYIGLFTHKVPNKHGKASIVSLTSTSGPLGGMNGSTPAGLPITTNPVRQPQHVSGSSQHVSGDEDIEGFFDIIKIVGQVGSHVLPIAGGLLGGPIGGGIATIAGSLLGAVSGAESAVERAGGSISNLPTGEALAPGAAERAVLAEAALQTIVSLDHGPVAEGLLRDVMNTFKANAPNINQLAKQFGPVLTKHALDMAIQGMNKNITTGRSSAESTIQRQPLRVDGTITESFGEPLQGSDLLECLLTPTLPLAGEEGFFDGFGSLISKAISVGKPFVTNLAKGAIEEFGPKVVGAIASKLGGAESAEAPTAGVLNEEATRFAFKRAILADASLQALQRLDKRQLQQLRLRSDVAEEHQMPEEGAFDFLKTVAQKVGSLAIGGAKSVFKTVAPMALDAAMQKLTGGGGGGGGLRTESAAVALGSGVRKPKKSSSVLDMLSASHGAEPIKVSSFLAAREDRNAGGSSSLQAEIDRRHAEWQPLPERRMSLDSNPDLPVRSYTPPP
ncbi:hypothetical protein CC79DRAFT_1365150 [Sarocladium strictum]